MHAFAVGMMLSSCHVFLVAVMILISVVQVSFASPTHKVSEAAAFIPEPLDTAEFSLPSSIHSRRLGKVGVMPKAYVRTRGTAPPGHIAFKFLHRGPNYEILPVRVGAVALHTFYTTISHSASTMWPQTKRPAMVFTITQGALQLTMTGFGTAVPWDFVEDWAMKAAESVARGWTDTFDAGYEVEGTGVGVWVSLRLLEEWVGKEDAIIM